MRIIPLYKWNKGLHNMKLSQTHFMNQPWAGGVTLLVCVIVAMLLANLPFTSHIYHEVLETSLSMTISNNAFTISFPQEMTVEKFINDILMVVFFFTVGLEIKREVVCGELSSVKKALLPVIAAAGGMAVPALFYTLINLGTTTVGGWGIPTATDIAFAVGIMSILGNKVPVSLKVFLTALAIADDLGAILVVAFFYGGDINLPLLFISLILLGGVFIMNKLGEKRMAFYLVPAIVIWFLFYYSGIHSTMSGVAMAFIQRGSQNWDLSVKDSSGRNCQERFEQLMRDFARVTEHPELATSPIIPFGHSAQATFPWNFAAWNPERTLCVISYHGDAPRTNLCGYGQANVEWGRTRNIDFIPGLMIEGEYEWWEARVRPALAFRMMYPDSRISFLCDAGKGHFDLCSETQNYIALFIAKALKDPRPKGGVYYSRWHNDGVESQDPHDQFWYQDEEMVNLTRTRYQESYGKQMQYVSALINGQPVSYDPSSHVKMKTDIHCNLSQEIPEFTITPVFVDSTHNTVSTRHAQVRPRVVLLSGAAVQTGEYTFRYDPDYFGFDPKRLWDGITLSIEADGDATYKAAVQELNIQIR